jgi:hypothetical protein
MFYLYGGAFSSNNRYDLPAVVRAGKIHSMSLWVKFPASDDFQECLSVFSRRNVASIAFPVGQESQWAEKVGLITNSDKEGSRYHGHKLPKMA